MPRKKRRASSIDKKEPTTPPVKKTALPPRGSVLQLVKRTTIEPCTCTFVEADANNPKWEDLPCVLWNHVVNMLQHEDEIQMGLTSRTFNYLYTGRWTTLRDNLASSYGMHQRAVMHWFRIGIQCGLSRSDYQLGIMFELLRNRAEALYMEEVRDGRSRRDMPLWHRVRASSE